MTTELTQKLENIISGHSINEDDADWLRALTTSQPAQAVEVDERVAFCIYPKCLTTGRTCAGDCSKVPTQPAAQATPAQDVGASADYWGDLAQQKADADARRGVSMPVSYYTSSIVGALLATQQATPEPVGEPVAWRYKIPTHGGGTAWTHTRPQPECLIEAQPLYTHPAPGVPEDVLAILDECRNALMECDRDGDYALIDRIDMLAAAQAKGGEHG